MSDNRLKSFVERIAKLHEDRKAIAEDITEVVKEAAGVGYIPKTLRKVVARYLADPAKLAEDDALLETYEAALGRVGKALKAVREGSTWQEASEATGVPRATLARAEAVSKRREMIPEEKGEEAEASTPGAALPLERVESQATTEHSTDTPKPEDGDDGITGGEDGKAEADDDAARGVGSREDQGQQQWESRLADGRSVQHEETRDGADAGGGTQRLQHGVRSPAEGADPVRLRDEAPTTPSVGAVAAEPRVAPPFLGDDPGPTLDFLRGPSPANRRVA
tara:strand:- start:17523 stop:18359 length:837 start_codon:yes stop_codon:yes gene_type:complete